GVGRVVLTPARLPRRRAARRADGVRRVDDRHERLQQCPEGGPRRLLAALSEGGCEMSDLVGKVAFVTGAANGQGRATALALAREGAQVAGLDVANPLAYPGYAMGTQAGLESLAVACRQLGQECLTFAADVRDDAAVTAAVAATVERFGRIDVLFNNAG